jgi:Tol biopolymer transport system component
MRAACPRPLILGALAVLPLAASAADKAAPVKGRATKPVALVLTQLPAGPASEREPLANGTLRAGFGEGGRVVVVLPGGKRRLLSNGFQSAADPDVSFDGKRVAFAGKKQASDPWCIYEVNSDGTGLRQVTCGKGDCRQPVYQSTVHTLTPTATEAWVRVAFVGRDADEANEAGVGPNTSLWACKLDGTALRRLTFNLSNDMDPTILPDGRMVYAGWLRHSLTHGPEGRIALLGVNEDGTDDQIYAGDEGRRVKQMPTATAGGLVVFVEADRIAGDGAGSLASVSQRRPLHTYRRITEEAEGLFHSPSPMADGRVLVAWRPLARQGTYGIYRLDPVTGRREKAFDDPAWHDVQAKVLGPRPVPDGRSSVVRDSDPEGELYGLDMSISDLDPKQLPPGTAKRLRVLEGVPRQAAVASHPPLAARRFLGEAPLAEDGSFQVQIPANTPVQLQILDQDGLALRSSAWLWVRNHANQGCVGCHEDLERTPPNRMVMALRAPAAVLDMPVERRRTVDFCHEVAPIVLTRCVSCHGEGGKGPRLDGRADPPHGAAPSPAYEALLSGYVVPGEARRSPVIWHLFGRNTSRPWDKDDVARTFKPMPAKDPITDEEKRTFAEWIDLGALWDAGTGGER